MKLMIKACFCISALALNSAPAHAQATLRNAERVARISVGFQPTLNFSLSTAFVEQKRQLRETPGVQVSVHDLQWILDFLAATDEKNALHRCDVSAESDVKALVRLERTDGSSREFVVSEDNLLATSDDQCFEPPAWLQRVLSLSGL